MGKKNRKKTKGGAAPRPTAAAAATLPTIDLENIDPTVCAVCHDKLNVNHWDDDEMYLMMCCGHFLCLPCNERREAKREKARAQLDDVADDFERATCLDPSRRNLPKLVKIATDGVKLVNEADPPCPVCRTPLAKSSKEIFDRKVRLAQAGHSNAQYHLGQEYLNGTEVVRVDLAKAVKWLKTAHSNGETKACVPLGDLCQIGQGTPRSISEAKKWYEQAPNSAIAQYNLSFIYLQGIGVSQDLDRAKELLQKSAAQDLPGAVCKYGEQLFDQGKIPEALIYFERGARLEKYLEKHLEFVAPCQMEAARCLMIMSDSVSAKDLYPVALFWARRALKNITGHTNERMVKQIEAYAKHFEQKAHSMCRHCKKPNPQSKCSKCQAVSYCDKKCQIAGWKEGHKVACNDVPTLFSEHECAYCGDDNPGFQCQVCGKANYCGAICQKSHWEKGHSTECKFL